MTSGESIFSRGTSARVFASCRANNVPPAPRLRVEACASLQRPHRLDVQLLLDSGRYDRTPVPSGAAIPNLTACKR